MQNWQICLLQAADGQTVDDFFFLEWEGGAGERVGKGKAPGSTSRSTFQNVPQRGLERSKTAHLFVFYFAWDAASNQTRRTYNIADLARGKGSGGNGGGEGRGLEGGGAIQ